MKDGQKWARFDADVVDVQGNQITANFIDNFNNSVASLTFIASPEARLTIEGKEHKFSELQKGDTLSVWMAESRMSFYAQPGAEQLSKFALVSDSAKQAKQR